MKSNYKRLGDYIREVNNRNTELRVTNLLGINIDKFFMPSVANVVGTDMTSYKIVKMGQFACNRMHVGRDQRLPVSLSRDSNDFLVSPAYNVFEVIDLNALLPEYLMMWFSRREFDRNAWFYTDADVRGGLNWKDFCNMQLPIPAIAKQREIVKEYNVLVNRVALNNQLNQKLEETAQAIYKQWFVDFEFPDEDGKLYKSNGGEMVESEFGEIPKGWRSVNLGDLVQTQYGYTASAETNNLGTKFLRITDIVNKQIDWDNVPYCKLPQKELSKYLLKNGDIVIARTGANVGYAKRINKKHPQAVFASYLIRMTSLEKSISIYLGMTVDSIKYREFIQSVSEGSAQPQANANLMSKYLMVKPHPDLFLKLNSIIEPIFDQIEVFQIQNTNLYKLQNLLLSKLTTIEN